MALYYAIASIRISMDNQVLDKARDFATEKREAFMELSKRLVNSLLEPVDREEERFFRLKSVLTSIWVPCVVGDKNQNASMFFKSGLTSTTSKHIGVLIAIIVCKFKIYVPASLQFSSILFFCQDKATLDQNMTNTCQGWSECFNSSSTDLQQKIRLCGGEEDEWSFWSLFTIILCLSYVFSVVVIIFLDALSDYKVIFDLTNRLFPCPKSCCCLYCSLPVTHEHQLEKQS